MAVETRDLANESTAVTKPRVVDGDMHNSIGAGIKPYMSKRWREYQELAGNRRAYTGSVRATQRPGAARLDSFPPNGGAPGSDPEFAREQLLDRYDISAAIINNLEGSSWGNAP